MTYGSLEAAQQGKQLCLIPARFSMTDENYKEVSVQVGQHANECFKAGESSTQGPQAHTFNMGRKIIRLIDTPGMGDTRGPEKDEENFKCILNYLASFDELHGVVILLKPNNARLNLVFKYCINQLLAQLHKSAAANIMFCFTNARGTFYRPGDTITPLTTYLDQLVITSGVRIALSKSNIYCMDNESFRFLCCLHQGIKFDEAQYENYRVSWQQAEEETRRFLDHVETLMPHRTTESLTLNKARTTILTLAKPLSDIRKTIAHNMAIINDKIEEISRLDSRSIHLNTNKLNVARVSIAQKTLNHPRTVCTAASCVDTKPVMNTETNQTVFKTHCHTECGLNDVTPDRVPNPQLQECHAFRHGISKCTNCSHPWDLHMHIWYEQEEVSEMIEDMDVREAIRNNMKDKDLQQLVIENFQHENSVYGLEQNAIDQICAKFGAFLKSNAIVPYNDVIDDYIKLAIGETERLLAAPGGDTHTNRIRLVVRLACVCMCAVS